MNEPVRTAFSSVSTDQTLAWLASLSHKNQKLQYKQRTRNPTTQTSKTKRKHKQLTPNNASTMINRTVYTPLQKYMVRKAVAATAPKAAAAAAEATAPAAVQATTTATNIFRPSHVTTTTTTSGDEHQHVVYTPLQMYGCQYHIALSSSSSYSSPQTRSILRMMSSMSSSSSSSSPSSSITGDEIRRRRKEEDEDEASTPTTTCTPTTTKDVNFCYYYPYILTVLHSSLNEPSYEQQMMNLTAPTLEDNQVLSRSEIERLKANLCCL